MSTSTAPRYEVGTWSVSQPGGVKYFLYDNVTNSRIDDFASKRAADGTARDLNTGRAIISADGGEYEYPPVTRRIAGLYCRPGATYRYQFVDDVTGETLHAGEWTVTESGDRALGAFAAYVMRWTAKKRGPRTATITEI